MTIHFRDDIGTVAVKLGEYGIYFDQSKGIAIFEDEAGKEYRIPTVSLELLTTDY